MASGKMRSKRAGSGIGMGMGIGAELVEEGIMAPTTIMRITKDRKQTILVV